MITQNLQNKKEKRQRNFLCKLKNNVHCNNTKLYSNCFKNNCYLKYNTTCSLQCCYEKQQILYENLGPRTDPEGADQRSNNYVIEKCNNYNYKYKNNEDNQLFSDYGSENDDDDYKVDKYIQRRKNNDVLDVDTAINEAILAINLNSGTLIKLAIINVEIENVIKNSLNKVRLYYFCNFERVF